MKYLKNITAIIIGKITILLIKILRLGSSSTWPGHLALKANHSFIKDLLGRSPLKSVVVAGTNGKTTTAHLITNIMGTKNTKVAHNTSGANLPNGIASTLIQSSSPVGDLAYDYGVFEVDEGALPRLLYSILPEYLVLLNLSRDQLDRYGEVDITLKRWEEALTGLKKKPTLLINRGDKRLNSLAKRLQKIGFKVLFFGNRIRGVSDDVNVVNIEAARMVCTELGFGENHLEEGIKSFSAAFGRGEEADLDGRVFRMILSKNPASFNENLRSLGNNKAISAILFILNDNIPDGRDISWIYDIDSHLLKKVCAGRRVYVFGIRAYDFNLRLKYANVEMSKIKCQKSKRLRDLRHILKDIISEVPQGEKVVALPTYSAMLNLRKVLVGRRIG